MAKSSKVTSIILQNFTPPFEIILLVASPPVAALKGHQSYSPPGTPFCACTLEAAVIRSAGGLDASVNSVSRNIDWARRALELHCGMRPGQWGGECDGDCLSGGKAEAVCHWNKSRARCGRGRTVVAPAVPAVAITADSMFAPLSIRIVWPAEKSATLATCWHSPHTFRLMTAGCISGWEQRPRPALIFHGRTGARNMLRTLPPINWWSSAKVLASFAGRALAVNGNEAQFSRSRRGLGRIFVAA